MKQMGLNDIRKTFINFYKSKNHYPEKSASLIPKNDKSLLLINSGMAPLKGYFSGAEIPPAKRMTTCQKCIRTGDMENVGKTSRHGTFFEMLGSFSFGDYFKEQSLTWGWELMTEVFNLPKDKLWATIYENDDEAYEIWRKIGMPEERIVRLGKEDNFWEIGLGPCGPCSEIYYDRGEEFGCDDPNCKPGCECDRYVEFWNHVFTQFSKEEDGSYSDLEHPNIDTGMGLERLACIMQGVDSIFDIDTIKYILDGVVQKSGVSYAGGEKKTDISIRIITDHLRSMVFMISDGINPSNEGRGYVLRRIIRRAARHGRVLRLKEPFLYDLAGRVIEVSGDAYPELRSQAEHIKKTIQVEEEKFSQTIDQGVTILNQYIDGLISGNKTILSGEKAFKLYDTYGFPLELTKEILEENNLDVNQEGFEANMAKQREKARAGRHVGDEAGWDTNSDDIDLPATEFTGYESTNSDAHVLKIVKSNDYLRVYVDKTPFYAEGGGQVGDRGLIKSDAFEGDIIDTKKHKGVYCHIVKPLSGSISEGDIVRLEINEIKRNRTARNHTATHLLHKALKDILGDHVNQAGSMVNDNILRFDFSHYQSLSDDEISKVESEVNLAIDRFLPVTAESMHMDDAIKSGAVALFDEKYGDEVRVVSCGDYSKELCGGTHVSNTGEIGAFKIISETGISSGTRRIEAITGTNVLASLNEMEDIMNGISSTLKTIKKSALSKVINLVADNKMLTKEISELKSKEINDNLDSILDNVYEKNGVKLVSSIIEGANIGDLRKLSDDIKEQIPDSIIILAAVEGDKGNMIVSVSDTLLDKGYHAGKIIKEVLSKCDGRGGGKADMAQGGIGSTDKLDSAFELAKDII